MAVRYGKFQMPTNIIFEEDKSNPNFGRFIAEPFERGFGHTVGNTLRRIMLMSLEAPAIVSIQIEGVPHEYMPIDGVVEDMTNIVLNIKGVLLRQLSGEGEIYTRDLRSVVAMLDITQEMLDANGGKVSVTLGDLVQGGYFEVVNPELHIFSVTKPFQRRINLRVALGRGYVPSERHEVFEKHVEEIVVDSAFSPVRLVNYFVENTRVGQDTDYDRLVLEVTTDGRVSPREALSFAAQIAIKHFQAFDKIKVEALSFDEEALGDSEEDDDIMDKLALRIDEIELSVRSTNCLSGANIETIAELVTIPERSLLDFRNFGKKSLKEIQCKLTDMGLSLGMDLSRYGITHENVREFIEKFNQGRRAAKVDAD